MVFVHHITCIPCKTCLGTKLVELISLTKIYVVKAHHHFTDLQKRTKAMDPAIKFTLDEMQQWFSDELQKGFSKHDKKWDCHFLDLEHSKGARINRLEEAAQLFDEWRPRIIARIDNDRLELDELTLFGSICPRSRRPRAPHPSSTSVGDC